MAAETFSKSNLGSEVDAKEFGDTDKASAVSKEQ
jgi:hypothetical protein